MPITEILALIIWMVAFWMQDCELRRALATSFALDATTKKLADPLLKVAYAAKFSASLVTLDEVFVVQGVTIKVLYVAQGASGVEAGKIKTPCP